MKESTTRKQRLSMRPNLNVAPATGVAGTHHTTPTRLPTIQHELQRIGTIDRAGIRGDQLDQLVLRLQAEHGEAKFPELLDRAARQQNPQLQGESLFAVLRRSSDVETQKDLCDFARTLGDEHVRANFYAGLLDRAAPEHAAKMAAQVFAATQRDLTQTSSPSAYRVLRHGIRKRHGRGLEIACAVSERERQNVAVDEYRRALQEPNNASVFLRRCHLFARDTEWRAIAGLSLGIRRDGDVRAHFEFAEQNIKDKELVATAKLRLAVRGDGDEDTRLAYALKHGDADTRVFANIALADFRPNEAIARLESAATDAETPEAKARLAVAFAGHGKPDAEHLRAGKNHAKFADTRGQAALALARLHPDDEDAVENLLFASKNLSALQAKAYAEFALGLRNHGDAFAHLEFARRHAPNGNTQAQAEIALSQLRPLHAQQHLEAAVRLAVSADVKAQASISLAKVDDVRAVTLLKDVVASTEDPDYVSEAESLLAKAGDGDVLAHLNRARALTTTPHRRHDIEMGQVFHRDKDAVQAWLQRGITLSGNDAATTKLASALEAITRMTKQEVLGLSHEQIALARYEPSSADQIVPAERMELALVNAEVRKVLSHTEQMKHRAETELKLALNGNGNVAEHLRDAIFFATDPQLKARAHFHLAMHGDRQHALSHFRAARDLAIDPNLQANSAFMLGMHGDSDPVARFQEARDLALSPDLRALAELQLARRGDADAAQHLRELRNDVRFDGTRTLTRDMQL